MEMNTDAIIWLRSQTEKMTALLIFHYSYLYEQMLNETRTKLVKRPLVAASLCDFIIKCCLLDVLSLTTH